MGFSKANVYETLVAELKRLMELGVLKYGEKLPSVRTYAVDRRVNPNTVAKAYAALESEGYLRVQPKQGAFVCYGDSPPTATTQDEVMEQFLVWQKAGVTKERLEKALAQVYNDTVGVTRYD